MHEIGYLAGHVSANSRRRRKLFDAVRRQPLIRIDFGAEKERRADLALKNGDDLRRKKTRRFDCGGSAKTASGLCTRLLPSLLANPRSARFSEGKHRSRGKIHADGFGYLLPPKGMKKKKMSKRSLCPPRDGDFGSFDTKRILG